MKVFDQSLFVHPLDRTLMTKIAGSPAAKRVMDKVFAEGLDQMSGFLYSLSCVQLPAEHPACRALKEACACFGVPAVPSVYTVRSDDQDVQLGGCSHPVVLAPQKLLAAGCEEMLRGSMALAAASIAAGHHRIAFLARLADTFAGMPVLPALDPATQEAVRQWTEARRYTMDRAFFLFTGDPELTKKHIRASAAHDEEAWLRYQELEQFCAETGGRT